MLHNSDTDLRDARDDDSYPDDLDYTPGEAFAFLACGIFATLILAMAGEVIVTVMNAAAVG